jgi:hypothetical protein
MANSNVWIIRLFIASLSVAMIAAFLAGSRLGRRFHSQAETSGAGIQTVSAAIYALLGLLLAFTFSGAANRFDERRKLIIEEANTIGTAYRRLDLLPPSAQPRLRATFRRYVDSRIATYRAMPDLRAALALRRESEGLQDAIWSEAVEALNEAKETSATVLVLGAINPMMDITTTRLAVTEIHPPEVVYVLLAIFSLMSIFLVGFEMAKDKRSSGVHAVGLTVAMVFTIGVILDYEYPRVGWIRVDAMDHLLVDVRNQMK